MKCPRCGDENLVPPDPCPKCSFSGPLVQIEELSHVRYLLKELADWQDLGQFARDKLRARYLRRQRQLEIELGLRPPPLSPEEARDAAKEILRLQQLIRLLNQWHVQDWIEPGAADDLSTRTHKRISELRARLAEPDTPRDVIAIRPSERVAVLKSLRDEADRLHQEGGYVDEEAYQAAVADLERQVEQLEIRLGLRPRLKEEPALVSRKPAAPAVSPRPPREPITWERI